MPTASTSTGENLRWGLGWTLSMATLFSGYVLVLTLLRGSTHFQQVGTTWQIILGYYGAAVVAGVVLGLLRPLTDWRLGAFLVGALVGFSIYGAIGVSMYGFKSEVVWVALILSPFAGGMGLAYYDGGVSFSAKMPSRRLLGYLIALAAAAVLLWLDLKYHIINR